MLYNKFCKAAVIATKLKISCEDEMFLLCLFSFLIIESPEANVELSESFYFPKTPCWQRWVQTSGATGPIGLLIFFILHNHFI